MQGFDLNAFLATAQSVQQQPPQPAFQQQQQPMQWQGAPMANAQQQQGFGGGFPVQQPNFANTLMMAPSSTTMQAPQQQNLQQQQTQFSQSVMQQQAHPQAPAPVQMSQQQPPAAAIFFSEEWNPQWGWMSNFFPSPFNGTKGNCKYITVEQYYMEKKARCAGDEQVRQAIMSTTWNPINAAGQVDWQLNHQANQHLKMLGQQVRNLNQVEWDKVKTQVMRTALTYKFAQNQQLFDLLLKTGEDVLFEASQDDFWGIGCTEQQARSGEVPISEFGSNLVGFLLMEIRSTFRKTGKPTWALTQAEKPEVSMTRSEVPATAPVSTVEAPIVAPIAPEVITAPMVAPVQPEPKKEEAIPVVVQPEEVKVEVPKVEAPKVEEVKVEEVKAEESKQVPQSNPLPAADVQPAQPVNAVAEVSNAPVAQPSVPVVVSAEPVVQPAAINPLSLL